MFTRRLKIRIFFLATSLAALAVMALGSVGTALATGPNASVSFTGGSLNSGTIGTAKFNGSTSAVTLTGDKQDITIALPITVTDARGTGVGWSVTMGASTFKTADTLHSLPALSFTSVGIADASSDGSSTSSDTPSALTGAVPSTETPVYAISTFGNGIGKYDVTVNMSLAVPAGAYAGTYGSTFTETVTTLALT